MDPITQFIYATSGGSKAPFDCHFLVIAGGGAAGQSNNWMSGGGGAGGYITSWDNGGNEMSGGGATASSPLLLKVNTTYFITIGAGAANGTHTNGSESAFEGYDSAGAYFLISATGGGRGGAQNTGYQGGSGGGGGAIHNMGYSGGNGVSGQGYGGGTGYSQNTNSWYCYNYGGSYCTPTNGGTGGGGGAGGAGGASWNGGVGGVGQLSTISGSSVYRASGGKGYSYTNGHPPGYANINGYQSDGSGAGSAGSDAKNGRIYLRYPSKYTLTNPGGGLTFQSGWTGGYTSTTENCTEIVAGTGNIEFI